MATVETPAAAGSSRPPRHRNRRGRGGNRGGAATVNINPVSTVQPSEVSNTTTSTPPVQGVPPATTPSTQVSSNRGNHGRRGGARRGNNRGGNQLMMNGRTFGGNLTSGTPGAASAEGSLAGDAPEFVPGRPIMGQRQRGPPQARQPNNPPTRARRMSKSQAPDIATRTHEDIRNGQYECVICTNEVLPNSRVWNCKTCWSVLHLTCVKKWSKNEVSTHQQRAVENGELPPPRQWRCPGCNLPKQDLPNNYTCWCEKEVDPRSIAGLPPHSCGQTCSKPRLGKCPHPCELLCHAGPCPPCTHMGPKLSCFCGKEASAKRCQDTNYDAGWSCKQVCGDILPCGEHECQRECHEGLCGACEVPVDSKCFCGKVEKQLACAEREDEKESHKEEKTWIGSFNCGAECKRPYDCGRPEHYCESVCHVQDSTPAHCPLSPDLITHCPCGKTSLDALLPEPRMSCSDPVPHCMEQCQKLLACGHLCQQICHNGECRPCLQKELITCRCGRTTSSTVCHQGMSEPPCCARVCRSALNCGRHECGERCCAGEKKANERQLAKRKNRGQNPTNENVEAEHICLMACGRPLKCGNHSCVDLCHKGPCRSCLEAVFTEVSCACGKTVLQPPQPCGVKPPECRFDCTRGRTCGHPQIKHQCHEDEEACPKCPFLVEKPCICGKKTLKNQPCWFTEVRCGLPCGKKLKCGIHTCQSLCHRSGACDDATTPCSQPCGKKKTVCEHFCSEPCHAPYTCKEQTPCQAKTFITCACQNQKQPMKCLASKTSKGNTGQVLECNDECLKLIRNAKLAAALNIDPATHTDEHIPYSATTLSLYSESTKFAQQYEREFRVFATDPSEKRLRFKPMQPHQRAFIHALAEDFGLDSESQDPEPHRHVCIFKTPRFVSAPAKTLAQCVKAKPIAAVEPLLSKTLVSNAEPWNGFLLSDPRFALTIDEIRAELATDFASGGLEFDVHFLPSGDIALRALPSGSWLQKVDAVLTSLKPSITKKVTSLKIASSATLCAFDSNINVIRKEEQNAGSSGGWSQVAKGGNGVRRVVEQSVGKKSSFTVLGKMKPDTGGEKVKVKEKAIKQEDAVEDWEKEVEGWGDY